MGEKPKNREANALSSLRCLFYWVHNQFFEVPDWV